MEDLVSEPSYDVARLDKARKGLARNSNDFYATNNRLEILIRLMSTEPSSPKIMELIEALPWKAQSYIMSTVIKVLPDGKPNPSYNPKRETKPEDGFKKHRMPRLIP